MYFAYRFLVSFVLFLLFTTTAVAQYSQNQLRYPGDSLGLTVRGGNNLNWYLAQNGNPESVASTSTFGDGITYFVWGERGDFDWRVRGAAIDSIGSLLWIRTINDHLGDQDEPVVQAVPGGCIVAWWDIRDEPYRGSVYAQKISSTGVTQWPTLGDTIQGIPIAIAPNLQYRIRIVSDGNDGAILVWEDFRSSAGSDLFGTRILGNGQIAPGFRVNGSPIAVAPSYQPYSDDFDICSDGRGGAWVTWVDNRISGERNLFLQRLCSDGTLQFDSAGQMLIGAVGAQSQIDACPDGRFGAFIVWRNVPPSEQNVELYMQRIDSVGNALWSPDSAGVALTNVAGDQFHPKIVSVSVDTCIVGWEDCREDPRNRNAELYCSKVTGTTSMQILWGENGLNICRLPNRQYELRMASDGSGGAVFSWDDYRNYDATEQDIYAQHINTSGQAVWETNGRPIATMTSGQFCTIPLRVNHRFLFLWRDSRNGSEPIYRTMWDASGNPVNGLPIGGVETIPDIAWNCNQISALSNEPERFITTWVDQRMHPFGNRVYYSVNHSVTGEPIGCARDGNPITLDSNNRVSQDGNRYQPPTIPTPDLGAIILFRQVEGDDQYLHTQKISRNGERMWGDFGSRISSNGYELNSLRGVPDGVGGALLCYTAVDLASPNFYNRVLLQRIDANGQPQLPLAGVVANQQEREQAYSTMAKSGENFYIGYIQLDDENNSYYSVRVAQINLNGQTLWSRIVTDSARNGSNGSRYGLKLLPASNGGVVAYWDEFRIEVNGNSQIYAQKYDSTGIAQWTAGGIRLAPSNDIQTSASAVKSDDCYWFVWRDYRNYYTQIYSQRVLENGTTLDSTGHRVYPTDGWYHEQVNPKIVAGRNGSVYLFWTQFGTFVIQPGDTLSTTQTYGLHLDRDGQNADPVTWNGTSGIGVVSEYSGNLDDAIPDSWGGAIVGINRVRLHYEENDVVSVQRIYDRTCVDVKEVVSEALPSVYSLEQNYPNPFNGETKFRFTLPISGVVKVTIFDVMGREVVTPVHRQFQAGTFDVHWNGKSNTGVKVSSGVYFYRIEAGKYVSTKKMVMVQ